MVNNPLLPVLPPSESEPRPPAVLTAPTYQLVVPPASENEIHLLDYWRVIVKRKWLIVLCFIVAAATAYLWTLRQTPLYSATATLQIEVSTPNILPYQDFVNETAPWQQAEYIQTQCAILQSKSLASRVVYALHLDQDPRFVTKGAETPPAARPGKKAPRADDDIYSDLDDALANPDVDEAYSPHSGIVQGGLQVEPVRDSHLIRVSYISPYPELASQVTNTAADEFIQLNFEARYNAALQATEFLKRQLTSLKARLEKSEENLINYSREKGIMVSANQQDVVLQKLNELSTALTESQTDRIRRESLYLTIRGIKDPIANFPSSLRNSLIEELERKLSGLNQELAKQSSKFKDDWPAIQELKNQITETNSQLNREKQTAIKSIITEYETAAKREKLLQAAMDEQKIQANLLKESLIQYNILQREVETNKNVYEGMLSRLKEASVAAGLKSSNIRIVERAETPMAPFKPNPVRNLLMGMLIGLLLGVGLAFFIEYIDNTVKTPDQVEQLTTLPSLGVIPQAESMPKAVAAANRAKVMQVVPASTPRNGNSVELIVHNEPTTSLAEAFRSLRTSILLSNSDGPPHTVLFTSPRPSEGKTTVSTNTAVAFAQTGKRVLLLDLDLRKPRLHNIFNLDNSLGFSSFLAGASEISPLIHSTEIENLFVITAGPIPPNPAELLSSMRLKQALEILKEYFDHIIIDSPPLLSVSDSRIISRFTDGIILVIRSGETPKQVLRQAQKDLQLINAKVLGILINAANLRSSDYYYSKYHYYQYGDKYHSKRA